MRIPSLLPAALLALVLPALVAPVLAADLPPPFTDLVEVKAKRLDKGYLLPGADFREYKKVLLDPAEVAFKKGWMRDINTTRRATRRVSNEDAERIAAAARDGVAEIFAETFRKAGYELTTVPGPDVLRVTPSVVDLYINAPDTMSPGRTTSYTVEAGEATILVELRDSESGAVLALGVERRIARGSGMVTLTNAVTNRADFRRLFQKWADICVAALADLKANSPLPANLAEVGIEKKP